MLRTTENATANSIAEHLANQLDSCQSFPAVMKVALPDVDPLAWLDAQTGEAKLAWSERDSDVMLAGVGIAADMIAPPGTPIHETVTRCRELLRGHEDIRFYGGVSFDGTADWKGFGAGRFVVPRFLVQDGELRVTVMNRADIVSAKLDLQKLSFDVPAFDTKLPSPTSTKYAPTKDGWQSNVDEALTFIRSEVLEKLVLARKTTMTFDSMINPIALTSRMTETTHDCYVFCFQFNDGKAFVGATPERLFRRENNKLLSEVVAGTRPRGKSSGEDQRLAYELLTSEKDQLEHDIVRKSIRQRLHKFVDHLLVDTHASVLRLARKQHLCSEVQGTLKNNVEEGDLLERLHPTPAVGGYPTENALPEIARLEPFNRGWYAAPIGWVGANDAEFVVAIRSGLVEDNELSLFSGAGIVKGSDPDQEWNEVENKIRDFVEVLKG